jgi:heat shock protein HslJ
MKIRNIQKALIATAAFITIGCTQAEQGSDMASPPLMDTYWQLSELHSKAIKESTTAPTAHVIFDEAEGRITGSTGCNRFFGGFTLGDNNSVSFSEIGATRRACLPGEVEEQDYLNMLGETSAYSIESDKLSFSDTQQETLAVFTAVKP